MVKSNLKLITMSRTRRYSELRRLHTFEERFDYLNLQGSVGAQTFGFDRYINQMFYRSREWKDIRQKVILRDDGLDLGIPGYEIHGRLLIHHMNPINAENISQGDYDLILNPEFLITTTYKTHNAIHYGDKSSLPQPLVERRRGDTKLW